MYIQFASRYQWSPDVVNDLTPDMIEEFKASWQAENRVAEENKKKGKKEVAWDS